MRHQFCQIHPAAFDERNGFVKGLVDREAANDLQIAAEDVVGRELGAGVRRRYAEDPELATRSGV